VVEQASEFRAAGIAIVGISPDTPTRLARLRQVLAAPIVLVSDPHERVVTALCGGLEHCQILIDPHGIVRWGVGTESWTVGPPPEALLDAARALAH
jgi:peroxiredoxin